MERYWREVAGFGAYWVQLNHRIRPAVTRKLGGNFKFFSWSESVSGGFQVSVSLSWWGGFDESISSRRLPEARGNLLSKQPPPPPPRPAIQPGHRLMTLCLPSSGLFDNYPSLPLPPGFSDEDAPCSNRKWGMRRLTQGFVGEQAARPARWEPLIFIHDREKVLVCWHKLLHLHSVIDCLLQRGSCVCLQIDEPVPLTPFLCHPLKKTPQSASQKCHVRVLVCCNAPLSPWVRGILSDGGSYPERSSTLSAVSSCVQSRTKHLPSSVWPRLAFLLICNPTELEYTHWKYFSSSSAYNEKKHSSTNPWLHVIH